MKNERKNLLIIGAGEYGRLVKELAQDVNKFDKIEFLDDVAEFAIGKTRDIKKFANEFEFAIVAIGNSCSRLKFIQELKDCGYTITSIVHPKSVVFKSVEIGEGCVIEPYAVIQTGVKIHDGCLISSGAIIGHNAIVCKGCHVNLGAIVPPREIVDCNTKVEIGQVYAKEKIDV